MRQLLDCQEYPISKSDIIKKGFDCEDADEWCVAYPHELSQFPGCARYTSDRIKFCIWLQLLPIDNNVMFEAVQFMVDFRGMHFNAKKDLYIHFQKHASIFCRAMLSTNNGVGYGWCYVLLTSMYATKKIIFQYTTDTVGLYANTPLQYSEFISKIYQVATSTNKTTWTRLVSFLTYRRGKNKPKIQLMIFHQLK